MQTHSDIIDELGGYLKVAEELGLPGGTVSSMKSRNSIPPEYWSIVAEVAERQGKAITVDLLAKLRAPRTKRVSIEGAAA